MKTNSSGNSWLVKIDDALVGSSFYVLKAVQCMALWAMGMCLIVEVFAHIFKYGEGFFDISRLELLFMMACFVLLQRHIFYCRKYSMGFWYGLSRLMVALGITAVVLLCLNGIYLLSVDFANESFVRQLQRFLSDYRSEKEFVEYGMILFSIYLAASFSRRPMKPIVAKITSSGQIVAQPATKGMKTDPTL